MKTSNMKTPGLFLLAILLFSACTIDEEVTPQYTIQYGDTKVMQDKTKVTFTEVLEDSPLS